MSCPLFSLLACADSGKPMTGIFCPSCGVRIYNIPSVDHDVYLLKPGTLDDTGGLQPERMVWTLYRDITGETE